MEEPYSLFSLFILLFSFVLCYASFMSIVREYPKIRFNIGVAGFPNKEQEISIYQQKITETLGQIKEHVHHKEHEMYSVNPEDVYIDIYTSPHIADEHWCDICTAWNQGDLQIVLSEDDALTPENKFIFAPNIYKTIIANSLKDIAQVNTMIDWVTSQIDIAVLLWDGSENAHNGHIWNFIEHCRKADIPCIWIDTTDCEKRHWFQDIYPVPYDERVLWDYIDGFYVNDDLPKEPADITPQMFPLLKIWKYLSTRYEKKRGIPPVHDVTKNAEVNTGNFEDILLRQAEDREKGVKPFELERPKNVNDIDFNVIEANYVFLRKAFHDYEDAADRISPFIRATLFCRTWLPLLTTIFLAIGFYLTSIIKPADAPLPNWQNWAVWSLLAGIGFFISAVIYLYGLCNKKPHELNLKRYVVCRYVDEYLRVYIHFMAYGLPVSEHILNKAIRNKDDPVKLLAACRARRLIRMRMPVNRNIDTFICWNMLEHLKEFFESQIRYQETGRVRRFEGIKNSINKWSRKLLKLTVIFLLFRGIIQILLGAFPVFLPDKLHLSKAFISSLTNMLALLITALYDTIIRQDGINRYKGYYHIADKILSVLRVYEERLRKIRYDYQQNENRISYERIHTLTNDVMDGLIDELYMWCNETMPRG